MRRSQAEAVGLRAERDRLLASLYHHGNSDGEGGYTTTSSSTTSSGASTSSSSSAAASAASSPASLDHGSEGRVEGGYTSNDDSAVSTASSGSNSNSNGHSPRFRTSFGTFTTGSGGGTSSSSGGNGGGFPLFGALFLFTFLAAPSTLLLSLGRGRTTTKGDGLGGLLPQRPTVAVPAPMAGPLVAVSAIRDLALPFSGGSPGKGQQREYWPPVLYGPHLPGNDGEVRRCLCVCCGGVVFAWIRPAIHSSLPA